MSCREQRAPEWSERWLVFLERHWQQEPCALGRCAPPGLPSAAGLFRALVAASEDYATSRQDIEFFLDGSVLRDARAYLPRADDAAIEGYAARLECELGGREFTLLVANPHRYFGESFVPLTRFLSWLFEAAGMPAGGVDTSAFVGRYRKTPFGVHRGEMDVMTFPLIGSKVFRTWSSEYASKNPALDGVKSYPEHLSQSGVIRLSPGDVGYWPSETWHIAESDGELTAAWNVGFWWDRQPILRVLDRVLGALLDVEQLKQQRIAFPITDGEPEDIPATWREAISDVRAVASSAVLQDQLKLEWLRLRSAAGFRRPWPERCALDLTGATLTRTTAPILLCALDTAIGVAANGHGFALQEAPGLQRFLEELAAPAAAPRRLDFSACAAPLQQAMDLLYRASALDVLPP